MNIKATSAKGGKKKDKKGKIFLLPLCAGLFFGIIFTIFSFDVAHADATLHDCKCVNYSGDLNAFNLNIPGYTLAHVAEGSFGVNIDSLCNQECANENKNTFGFELQDWKHVTATANSTILAAAHTCTCTTETAVYASATAGPFSVSDEPGCITKCRSFSSKNYAFDSLGFKTMSALPAAPAAPVAAAAAQTMPLNYALLESLPGFYSAGTVMSDFPAFILAIYKFAIWIVGICGLFMLVIGGIMYMASAGNTSTASSAQGIITDALLGITAALGAYLILYVINPDLTNINLNFTSVAVTEAVETSPEASGTLQSGTAGSCGGLATQTNIASQCPDASSGLAGMLSCIAGKLPAAIINSISDSKGYANCTPNNWTKASCAHGKYSCHYGGQNCFSTGKSYAADLSTRNLSASQLIAAAQACGASYTLDEGNHVHASVGQAAGCGCN